MRTLLCALFLLVLPMASVADGKPGATAGAGFTDTALGFDRLPKEGARYRDGDFEVAGGADPRWSPWNPLHMEIARRRAEQAGTSLRRLTTVPTCSACAGIARVPRRGWPRRGRSTRTQWRCNGPRVGFA